MRIEFDERKIWEQGERESRGFLDKFWESMESMRFAVFLLVILTGVSLVGVLLPQFPPEGYRGSLESLYLHKYGELFGGLLVFLGMHHLFTVWWYYLLLGLLCFNLTVCSLKRLSRIIHLVRRIHFLEQEQQYRDQVHNRSTRVRLDVEQAAQGVRQLLRESGYRVAVRRGGSENNHLLYAKRGEFSHFGPFFTHISMVIIIIGAAISYMLSFEHFQWMAPGDVIDVPDLSYMAQPAYQLEVLRERLSAAFGLEREASALLQADRLVRSSDWRKLPKDLSVGRKFRLRLEKFEAQFTSQGKPKAYLSTVSVLGPQQENDPLFSYLIKVNDPLIHEGVYFYQSSYAPSKDGAQWVKLKVTRNDSPEPEVYEFQLKPGSAAVALGSTGDSIRIDRFVGNFKLDALGNVTSSPGEDRNPAVLVVITRNGEEISRNWSFKNFPHFSHRKEAPYSVVMEDYGKSYITGLSIRTHRSQGLIWFGFALMVLGVVLSFYVNHRQVWAMVKPLGKDEGSRVFLAGTSYKWKEPFKAEFKNMADKIKELSSG